LKVWFWGGEAFHANKRGYSYVVGDGVATLESLIDDYLSLKGNSWSTYSEKQVVLEVLGYQNKTLTTILAPGETIWFDYKLWSKPCDGRN
jgi:hypothetical protein